ncbi:MAG: ComEC/Rec2 family competence protein [Cyanobacteria bacterium J06621_8]
MSRSDLVILGLAYLGGLLSTNLIADQEPFLTSYQLGLLLVVMVSLCAIAKFILKTPLVREIKLRTGVMALIVALAAVCYLQVRMPRPQANDVSFQVQGSELVTLQGKVLTEPRLNERQRLRFWLKAQQLESIKQVRGKVYVTLPLLQGTGIHPGQELKIQGILYLPQGASNPGGFDFSQYLARQGIFSGMQGLTVEVNNSTEPTWGWWKLRRRIVRSHLQGLGSPLGQLVSSMVLGRKAVDLPSEIRDRFIQSGLAHVLAASGFHVSLLLGIILRLTSRCNGKTKLTIGTTTLLIYLGLTGLQASVVRAGLMGFAVLLALALDTKVKPLGSLLMAAILILLINPWLIKDLGFQLSFLATFGLIVTLPALQGRLEWLPTSIATLVAVPLSASLWVLPLLCYEFYSLATYSILVNILTTPLITIISLGGMVSAIAALIFPALGSAIARLLFYPTLGLTKLTELVTNLPGSSWAVGQIPLGVLLLIYGGLIMVWLSPWFRRRWGYILLAIFGLIMFPSLLNLHQVKVTILTAKQAPIVLIQDRGETILINSGQQNQAKYTILPFLAQQGINQIDYGLAQTQEANSQAEWQEINHRAKIKHFSSLTDSIDHLDSTTAQTANQPIVTPSARLSFSLLGIKLRINQTDWMFINPQAEDNTPQEIQQYIQQQQLENPILVWSGNKLDPAWLDLLQPQMAIATTRKIAPATQQLLNQRQIKLHNIAQSGSISWTPRGGFQTQSNELR